MPYKLSPLPEAQSHDLANIRKINAFISWLTNCPKRMTCENAAGMIPKMNTKDDNIRNTLNNYLWDKGELATATHNEIARLRGIIIDKAEELEAQRIDQNFWENDRLNREFRQQTREQSRKIESVSMFW